MEIKIDKLQVEKTLLKLIPSNIFSGQTITRIEAHYDGSLSIHMAEIEEKEENTDGPQWEENNATS